MSKVISNCERLIQAAIAQLQRAGWTEAQIIAELPYLATEAVAHLASKREG